MSNSPKRQTHKHVPIRKSGTPYQEDEDPGLLKNFIKNPKTIEKLQKKGVKSLFPVQYRTFKQLLNGKDLMVRDKTGSGKTLAFALPIIERLRADRAFEKNHLAKFLIVLPTRELAMQVKDQIASLKFTDEPDFRVVAVYGQSDIRHQMDTIRNGIDIIVGTPGRLIDLLQRDVIKMNELQVLCLDQADEMLKQGFQEDLEKIYKYIKDNAPKKTQNLLFSATIPQWLHQISRTYQDQDREFVNLLKEDALVTPLTLKHYCLYLQSHSEAYKPKVISNLLKKYATRSGNSIIFCERKNDVTRLASSLNDLYNIRSECLHSDIPQPKRERAYRNFKSGELKCIIATNVAARGLDFPEIDIVIQAEPPVGVESYIHRSGRTARKGRDGICVTIYGDRTERLINNIERQAKIKMTRLESRDFLAKDRSREEDRGRDRDEYGCDRQRENRDRGRDRQNRDRYKSAPKEQSRKAQTQDEDSDYQVYGKNFPCDKNESDIKAYFDSRKIRVKSVKVLRTSNGDSRGCVFLRFSSRGDRNECMELDGEEFDENRINLSIPNKR